MNLIIVSGISGSGKTIALQALEDIGCYCIDNLPAALLPHVVEEFIQHNEPDGVQVAVGMDVRNRKFLDELPESLKTLKARGIKYRIIFLEADESILVKRYKESRRKHPMADERTSLLEGIRLEKKLLGPLSDEADLRIDTTHTTPQALRHRIKDYVSTADDENLTLHLVSFGFKHGTPLDADFVFDVRCLPNPYWNPELRKYTGLDEPVEKFLQEHDEVRGMIREIVGFLEKWLPSFLREQRAYLTVAIGCTGGQHRSVYITERLGEEFEEAGMRTQVRHRELP